MILTILESLAAEPSTKRKLELLQGFDNLQDLKRVCELALDKVRFNYNIRQIPEYSTRDYKLTLRDALSMLEELQTLRGYAGRDYLIDVLGSLSKNDQEVIKRIIQRDLKCGVGRTMVNKVWKDLITKPPYMRCNVFSDKTSKHITFPAILQEKCDGRFLYIIKDNTKVTYMSRQGEESDFPQLTKDVLLLPNGVYVGELLVRGLTNRSEANGLLNSDEGTLANVYVQLWDYLTLREFSRKSSNIPYATRLEALSGYLNNIKSARLYIVETLEVGSIQEALVKTGQWMAEGREGGVLKDKKLLFKDHTSNQQLKLKLEMSIEVRCMGFTKGTPGTKREHTFGALVFANDEGTIQGQCSGFTDTDLWDIHCNRDNYMGKVLEVQFNDLSKARDSDTYSLMHPRFICFRDDKDETDTLEKALEIRQMAMRLV